MLQDRYDNHHVTVYPDASGGSRKTVNASVSDIQILRSAGFAIRAPKGNPPVKDRILAVNVSLEKGLLFINDTKCADLAQSLEQQAYDKNGEPDKTGGHDHHNDALGYFCHQKMPVLKPTIKQSALSL